MLSALYSDRVGRRRVIMVSCGFSVVWALALFPLLDTGSPVAFVIGMMVTLAIFGITYGPCGALLPEMFATRYRYTGAPNTSDDAIPTTSTKGRPKPRNASLVSVHQGALRSVRPPTLVTAGLGYNLAGVLGGAIPPLLAAPLAATFGSVAIGVMLAALGLLSLVCTARLVETRHRAL